MCYSVQLASIFMFFASYVHHGYCPVIFFLCSIICLWYQSNFGLKISLEVFPLLHYFGKNFRRIGVNYLNVWWNLPGKPCGPTHFFFGCFFDYWFNFLTCYRSVCIFYSWFGFSRLYVSRNFSSSRLSSLLNFCS